jgi:5'-nucleotidase
VSSCAYSPEQSNSVAHRTDSNSEQFTVQLLGINDFHGQISQLENHGGMYQLSRHLLHAIGNTTEHSFILHAGDHVGASPAESALLQDEPAIDFLNLFNNYCQSLVANPCEIIGAAGNHEFDEGSEEMKRLLEGGNHADGPFIHPQWQGANYITLGANVIDKQNNQAILPPYVVHTVNGVPIGFIGITLDITPELVVPGIVDDLRFENQASTVAKYVNELQSQNVQALVVIVHDGTADDYYAGDTKQSSGIDLDSRFGRFVQALPDAVDVLVTGHSHRFTNAYVSNTNGKQFLVTQAFSSGRAYSDITITLNKQSGDIVQANAKVVMTEADANLSLDAKAKDLLADITTLKQASINYAQSLTNKRVGDYLAVATENDLGQFIADSHRFALKADLAIMNRGGVRADLVEGEVTWGQLFAIQPFNNPLVVREYTGAQLKSLLVERHFYSQNVKIDEMGQIQIDGLPLEDLKTYTMAGNGYILNNQGYDQGRLVGTYGLDIDATVDYIKLLQQPFNLSSTPVK